MNRRIAAPIIITVAVLVLLVSGVLIAWSAYSNARIDRGVETGEYQTAQSLDTAAHSA